MYFVPIFVVGLIYGGRDIDSDRHPYLLSLRNPTTKLHACAAFLVSPSLAMTAAHCFSDVTVPLLVFTSGNVSREISVDSVVTHPDWTGKITNGADMALIVLKFPLAGHPTLRVLPQPIPFDWEYGKLLHVLGWGLSSSDSRDSGIHAQLRLQGADLHYVPLIACNEMYREAGYGRRVLNLDMMCA